MRFEPSVGTGETAGSESLRRIVTKGVPAAVTLLVAALTLGSVVIAGTGAVAADGTAEIGTDVITVSEDGTAEVVVETDGVDAFEVVVGGEDEVGYELRATVTPSGDGVTTLVLDHAETGGDGTPLTADGDATVEIERETSLESAIAPGGYDVELLVGGDPADVSTLVVEEAEDGGSDGDASDGSDGDGGDASDETADGGSDGGEGSTEPATVTEGDVEAADLVVEPAETEVSVPVEADDGETVSVRIRSTGDASPAFIMTREATVEGGTANATFDLSRAAHGDRATLTVHGNEALNGSNAREVLVVDESIGVEGDGSVLGVEAPGFGVVVSGLAVLAVALVARSRE
ncbi:BGTF surface domain-containing protein [Halorubrum ejinorense]|uniref:BGTF surface domain-containing protein n=1 Tax=Halorubrum ejinorense TaxID=425309 RepID=A0AAV3SU31_9EURY